MKKKLITIGITTFSILSMADYVAFIDLSQVKKSLPEENNKTIKCNSGDGVDRTTLLSMIKNGDDVTNVCTSNITDFSIMFQAYNRNNVQCGLGGSGDGGGTGGGNGACAKNFNQDISKWDVSNGVNFKDMFYKASSFNQDISSWDVSNATNFNNMFFEASSFNQDISAWDVSNVTDFGYMFSFASAFNQDIGNWNVSNSNDFKNMFENATEFNQDIGAWDVVNGTNFSSMFCKASKFNQDIGDWNVSNGVNFAYMFDEATDFNQDLHFWDVEIAMVYSGFKGSSSLSYSNIPCKFGGNCSLDSDNDGVADHQEVYNGTDPLDSSSN